MLYTVKITSSDGKDVIQIGKFAEEDKDEISIISGINVMLDTVDENVRQKSNAMLAKLTIYGEIRLEVTDKLIDLYNWARNPNQNKWYRTVEIEIKSSGEDVVRRYIFEKMFVVDYKETYDKEDNNCQFELVLTQKENNLDNIETFDN